MMTLFSLFTVYIWTILPNLIVLFFEIFMNHMRYLNWRGLYRVLIPLYSILHLQDDVLFFDKK